MDNKLEQRRKNYIDKVKRLQNTVTIERNSITYLEVHLSQFPFHHPNYLAIKESITNHEVKLLDAQLKLAQQKVRPFPMPTPPPGNFSHLPVVAVPVSIGKNRPVTVNTLARRGKAYHSEGVSRFKDVVSKHDTRDWAYLNRWFGFDPDNLNTFRRHQARHLLKQMGYMKNWVHLCKYGFVNTSKARKTTEDKSAYLARVRERRNDPNNTTQLMTDYLINYRGINDDINKVQNNSHRINKNTAKSRARSVMSPLEKFDYYNYGYRFDIDSFVMLAQVERDQVAPNKVRLIHAKADSESLVVLYLYCLYNKASKLLNKYEVNIKGEHHRLFYEIALAVDTGDPDVRAALEMTRALRLRQAVNEQVRLIIGLPDLLDAIEYLHGFIDHADPLGLFNSPKELFNKPIKSKQKGGEDKRRLPPSSVVVKVLTKQLTPYNKLLNKHGLTDSKQLAQRFVEVMTNSVESI